METPNNNSKLQSRIEALLFLYGEPMNYKKIAKTLEISESEVETAINAFSSELAAESRGLSLIIDKGLPGQNRVQLVTKPEFGKLLEDIVKEEVNETLTPVALETLAIVAYSGPISRAEIEYIRGVNSTFMLRNLMIRGLVDREPDPKRSNVYLYRPSLELLKFIGISKTEDLPEYQRFNELVKKLWQQPQQNNNNGQPTA